ncbi:MAG TPA: enoyl-CoA hydratase/isomerase family protein [Terriglobales bacterium]|jgi:enoyl-CoA hydratase/carnithine racemase|nr:enoyl-CoA hydratase/isomerase family protein [Terriglobales bacterium]
MILTINHGPVRELRLNRPPANALSPELIAALTGAVEAAVKDGVRGLVLSGSPSFFSGGLDVPLLLKLDRATMNGVWRDFYGLLRTLACSPMPIAAAITGHAPAGGTVLALFCDYRIAAEGDWKLGLNEVQVGLPLPPVIYSALQRLVGTRQAARLAIGGLLVSPAESLGLGLVDEVVPAEQVIDRAVKWCQEWLALPSVAMTWTRRQARADLTQLFEQDVAREIEKISGWWWDEQVQSVLRALMERLAKKKQ